MGTFVLIFITKYFLSYKMWYKFDKFMHTKIIKFPNCIKCFIKLNKDDKYCYNKKAKSTWESQENGDFDFYTLGHLIMWAIIGHRCKISSRQVFIFSVFLRQFYCLCERYSGDFSPTIKHLKTPGKLCCRYYSPR